MTTGWDLIRNNNSLEYGGMGGRPQHPMIFFENPSIKIKIDAPKGCPLPTYKWRKKRERLETAINTCVSLIKQHWKKMAEIPQKCGFFHLKHSKFR